jgi:hypothetical protein
MADGPKLTRRGLLGSTVLIGVADAVSCRDDVTTNPVPPSALAQFYTIVERVPPPDPLPYFIHDPAMCRTPSGVLIVAAPSWHETIAKVPASADRFETYIARSADGGRTWRRVATLPYSDVEPFVFNGGVYMFVQKRQFGGINLVRGDESGSTWSDPVHIPLQPRGAPPSASPPDWYWSCGTPLVVHRGRLLVAMNSRNFETGGVVVIGADTTKDLMDPSAWTMSNEVMRPDTPPSLVGPRLHADAQDAWYEPNLVLVGDRVRVLLRTSLDSQAATGVAMVCDLTDSDQGLALAFTRYASIPGMQNKVAILFDPDSRLFWMLSNLAVDSEEVIFDWAAIKKNGFFVDGGNDRRFLMLWYSLDALNWFPAGCVARTSNPRQSFMNTAVAIDGDDFIFISRTSIDGLTQHDADVVTFHRVTSFRSLAMNLFPVM